MVREKKCVRNVIEVAIGEGDVVVRGAGPMPGMAGDGNDVNAISGCFAGTASKAGRDVGEG